MITREVLHAFKDFDKIQQFLLLKNEREKYYLELKEQVEKLRNIFPSEMNHVLHIFTTAWLEIENRKSLDFMGIDLIELNNRITSIIAILKGYKL